MTKIIIICSILVLQLFNSTIFATEFIPGDLYMEDSTKIYKINDSDPSQYSTFVSGFTNSHKKIDFGYADGYVNSLFLTDPGGNKIRRYDADGQETGSWVVGSNLKDLKCQISDGDTEFVYFSQSYSGYGYIKKLDLSTGQLTTIYQESELDPYRLALEISTVGNSGNSIWIADKYHDVIK